MHQESPFKISWGVTLPNLEIIGVIAETSSEQYHKCKENCHALLAFIMKKNSRVNDIPIRKLQDLGVYQVSFQNGLTTEHKFTLT
jgi:hypothetical protein